MPLLKEKKNYLRMYYRQIKYQRGKKKREAVSHKINKNDLYFHYNESQCGFIFVLCRTENSKHFQF